LTTMPRFAFDAISGSCRTGARAVVAAISGLAKLFGGFRSRTARRHDGRGRPTACRHVVRGATRAGRSYGRATHFPSGRILNAVQPRRSGGIWMGQLRWLGPDAAECVFEGRITRRERVMP
jgi:hypothetical protein